MLPMKDVDFTTGWDKFISIVESAAPGILGVLMVAGISLLVYDIGAFFWSKRKGAGGGQVNKLGWQTILGAIFVAPKIAIPAVLKVLELIAGIFVTAFNTLF